MQLAKLSSFKGMSVRVPLSQLSILKHLMTCMSSFGDWNVQVWMHGAPRATINPRRENLGSVLRHPTAAATWKLLTRFTSPGPCRHLLRKMHEHVPKFPKNRWHPGTQWLVLHSIKQMKHVKSQSWDDGTLSLGQSNPSHEKLSQCSSGQLDVFVSAMTEVLRLQKERKTSSGLARLKRRQDSLQMSVRTCFLSEFISHPTVKVLMLNWTCFGLLSKLQGRSLKVEHIQGSEAVELGTKSVARYTMTILQFRGRVWQCLAFLIIFTSVTSHWKKTKRPRLSRKRSINFGKTSAATLESSSAWRKVR